MYEFPTFEVLFILSLLGLMVGALKMLLFSPQAKEAALKRERIEGLPEEIKSSAPDSSYLGWETQLDLPIYFPDRVRSRHVHIMGATGSGKTESVLLNLIDQDANRGHPIVIVDAKGDESFVKFLRAHPYAKDRLLVFDVGELETSVRYNPLAAGTASEAVSRLFNSMTWSEEFYKTRARETLLRLAEKRTADKQAITLEWLRQATGSAEALAKRLPSEGGRLKTSEAEYGQLAGLVAQISQLSTGEIGDLISGAKAERELNLAEAIAAGKIIYFRLPALVDPVMTATIGKVGIADLAYY